MFDRDSSNNNILVYRIDDFDELDEFTLKMVRANPIEGVLTIGIDNNSLLLAVSNLALLDDYLRSEDCELTVDDILNQFEEIKSKVEGYMIPADELILNYEFAYTDSGKLRLPLVPTTYSHFETHTEKEFVLCCKDALGDKPKKAKGKKKARGTETSKRHSDGATENELKKSEAIKRPSKNKKAKRSVAERMRGFIFSGSGDDVFDFENEGMLPEGVNVIKVRSTGAEYPLLFGPDTVGTDESRCSIPLSGKPKVEAEHCVITLAHGKYNIADLNSKGGTLLNGLPLEPGKTYELRSADLITVGDEELVFSRRA